jgi:hypothetical protein
MRKRRTIYHNDARHNYLWMFEPPITLEQAWTPVDEVAGTAVDTLSYCVERGDGAFWPTKVGLRFGADMQPFTSQIVWRAWQCMQSLIDRGLDPLQVVIDRAHDKDMDFIADLRLSTYGGMDPSHKIDNGGRGWGHNQVRDHQLNVVKELVTDYPLDGVELDYTAAFGRDNRFYFSTEYLEEGTTAMTDWVRQAADLVRANSGGRMQIGARIYPTEAANLAQGLDVATWLDQGLLDFVIPILYTYTDLDPNMPFSWVVEPAHKADASVYGFLQHYVRSDVTGAAMKEYPTPEMFRAAAANYWDWGVDGLCTYMLNWPLGVEERAILSEWGSPDMVKEKNKHYVLARRSKAAAALGYDHALPHEFAALEAGKAQTILFYIADDLEAAAERVAAVRLRLYLTNSVSADRFTMLLNGRRLAAESCRRIRKTEPDTFPHSGPRNFWLDFHLEHVRPAKGHNVLSVALDGRPEGLGGSVTLQEVEIIIDYSPMALPEDINSVSTGIWTG